MKVITFDESIKFLTYDQNQLLAVTCGDYADCVIEIFEVETMKKIESIQTVYYVNTNCEKWHPIIITENDWLIATASGFESFNPNDANIRRQIIQSKYLSSNNRTVVMIQERTFANSSMNYYINRFFESSHEISLKEKQLAVFDFGGTPQVYDLPAQNNLCWPVIDPQGAIVAVTDGRSVFMVDV